MDNRLGRKGSAAAVAVAVAAALTADPRLTGAVETSTAGTPVSGAFAVEGRTTVATGVVDAAVCAAWSGGWGGATRPVPAATAAGPAFGICPKSAGRLRSCSSSTALTTTSANPVVAAVTGRKDLRFSISPQYCCGVS